MFQTIRDIVQNAKWWIPKDTVQKRFYEQDKFCKNSELGKTWRLPEADLVAFETATQKRTKFER